MFKETCSLEVDTIGSVLSSCQLLILTLDLSNWGSVWDIKNNAWVTVNNDFLSRVRRFGNENHCRLASRVTKIVIHGNEFIYYFLHTVLCHSHTNSLRTIIERSFRHCCHGWPFLIEHCDVTTIDLWRHANAKYWYCDVIFLYCHCTRKLTQRRSSLVNNSREYRYLATRY